MRRMTRMTTVAHQSREVPTIDGKIVRSMATTNTTINTPSNIRMGRVNSSLKNVNILAHKVPPPSHYTSN
jgi:hypothetical protein